MKKHLKSIKKNKINHLQNYEDKLKTRNKKKQENKQLLVEMNCDNIIKSQQGLTTSQRNGLTRDNILY